MIIVSCETCFDVFLQTERVLHDLLGSASYRPETPQDARDVKLLILPHRDRRFTIALSGPRRGGLSNLRNRDLQWLLLFFGPSEEPAEVGLAEVGASVEPVVVVFSCLLALCVAGFAATLAQYL